MSLVNFVYATAASPDCPFINCASTIKEYSGLLRGCEKPLIKVYSLLSGNAGEICRKERIDGGICAAGQRGVCEIQGTAVESLRLVLEKINITSSVYDCTVEDVEYIYNKLSIHIFNSKSR